MSILIDKHTRIITQGIASEAGRLHTAACLEYGHGRHHFVAGVNPLKPGESLWGIPIYGSVAEAKDRTGATVSVIYAPPAFAAAAIDEAVDAQVDLVICVTEGIPVRDMIRTRRRMEGRKTLLLGPSCPGLVVPGEVKIGTLPGHIHQRGRVGIVSRSAMLSCEATSQLAHYGIGQSTVVGIGGDPIGGLRFIDVLQMFNDDRRTDAVIMIGEIGGNDEEQGARWVRDHMRKPVVGFVAGASAPPDKRMGHAGAIVSGGRGTAQEKLAVMKECGIHVTRNPAEMGKLLASLVVPDYLPFD